MKPWNLTRLVVSGRFGQVLPKEAHNAAKRINLRQAGEVMALAGIDFHFMRDPVFFENSLQLSGFLDGNHGILVTVENQNRRKLCRVSREGFGESAKEFDHSDDPRVARGQRQRE